MVDAVFTDKLDASSSHMVVCRSCEWQQKMRVPNHFLHLTEGERGKFVLIIKLQFLFVKSVNIVIKRVSTRVTNAHADTSATRPTLVLPERGWEGRNLC